jgi:hypothetical protein
MITTTSLEMLKTAKNNSILTRDDWIMLKEIYSTKQSLFRPCDCAYVNKTSVHFTIEASKTFYTPHPAAGLGDLKTTFKCNGCKKSFNSVTMLIKYYESVSPNSTYSTNSTHATSSNSTHATSSNSTHATIPNSTHATISNSTHDINSISTHDTIPNSTHDTIPNSTTNPNSTPISLKRPRVVSPPTELTQQLFDTTEQPMLWSDSVSPEMLSLSSNNHFEVKLDRLASMFLEFQTQSLQKQESTQNMFDRMMTSIDTLLSRNEKLEDRIENLQSRLKNTEEILASREPTLTTSTTSNVIDTTSITMEIASSSSASAVTIENQPSWAIIAKSSPIDRHHLAQQKAKVTISRPERLEGFQALTLLTCKTKRVPQKRKLEIGKTKALYFSGFEFQKLSTIWNALKKAWFKTSLIASIQWVGKTVLEFIIATDYEDEFSSELTSNKKLNFKIIKFDPTQNLKATTLEQSEYAMKAFVVRCVKNIFLSSNLVARHHFELLAEKSCNLNPNLKSIFDVEFLQCKNELEKETTDLINKLSQLGAEDDSDYLISIQRLRLLQPTHPLVLHYLQHKTENADSKPLEALAVSSD